MAKLDGWQTGVLKERNPAVLSFVGKEKRIGRKRSKNKSGRNCGSTVLWLSTHCLKSLVHKRSIRFARGSDYLAKRRRKNLLSTSLATKETVTLPFYTKKGHFHFTKSQLDHLQKKFKICRRLQRHLDIVIHKLPALLINAHGVILDIWMVVKRYLQFYMGFPYKRYIATRSNLHSELLVNIVEWKNSDKIYLENLGNFLYYGINFISSMLFLDELRLPKIGHFWCKTGGVTVSFVAKLVHKL